MSLRKGAGRTWLKLARPAPTYLRLDCRKPRRWSEQRSPKDASRERGMDTCPYPYRSIPEGAVLQGLGAALGAKGVSVRQQPGPHQLNVDAGDPAAVGVVRTTAGVGGGR